MKPITQLARGSFTLLIAVSLLLAGCSSNESSRQSASAGKQRYSTSAQPASQRSQAGQRETIAVISAAQGGSRMPEGSQMGSSAQTRPSAQMPSADVLQSLVARIHDRFKDVREGKNADYIPILARVDSNLFGVVIATADGRLFTAGDVDHAFSIQSVSKPFTMALVMRDQGPEAIQKKIGVEPTGLPFNSVMAIELNKQRSVNPVVNAGAMASVSMLEANSPGDRWLKILNFYGECAGEKLALLDEVYKSEAETNLGNRAIAALLLKYERLYCDPMEAVDVYTKQCSVGVTAKQLAIMGATLANGGVNPITGKRVIPAAQVPHILAVMMTCGFYDESGAWAYHAGLPAKTGVGGGIVAVVPGRMAIVGFSPPLNEAGNSVRSAYAIRAIVNELGLNLFDARSTATLQPTGR